MQTITRFMALSALSVALVACGGGGGGGSPSVAPVVQGGTNNAPTTKPQTPPTISTANTVRVAFLDGRSATQVVAPPASMKAEIQNVIAETNKLRAEKGLKPLVYDDRLSAHAQLRAVETVQHFSHVRPDGRSWDMGLRGTGTGAENLASGGQTAKVAVKQWRDSPSHYQAIMTDKYTKIGVGVVHVPNSQYGYYWVQIFGEDAINSEYQFNDITANVGINRTTQSLLQHLVVGNTAIPLGDAPNGNWKTFTGGNYNGTVNGYDHSRFGVIRVGDDKQREFYQGNQTIISAMPTTGIATYNGKAVVVNGTQVDTSANAKFNVDFAKKNLTGAITPAGKSAINLKADIAGNTFASSTGATVKTQGTFFGGKAEELGGVFEDTKSGATGAFGAKK